MLDKIIKSIGNIKCKRLDSNLEKEKERAIKLYNEKSDTVVCQYCGKLLKKKEAGMTYDIANKEISFFHEQCFDENEKIGTLEDLKKASTK